MNERIEDDRIEQARVELEGARAEDDAARLEVLEKVHSALEEEVDQSASSGR